MDISELEDVMLLSLGCFEPLLLSIKANQIKTIKVRIQQSYNDHGIPVLLIMTSNAPDDSYMELMNKYKAVFDSFIGPTEILAVGETMQVSDYSQFNWTMFNAEDRKVRRETVFPEQCRKAFEAGVRLAAE